jgi:hypothetical protein
MPGFWRKCRITFRWLRIAAWLLVLAVLGAFLWFNRVGLPDFLKTPLVAALREQGVELQFSRMRLSLVRGLVADNVRAGQPGTDNGPVFSARLVELELDYSALWRRRLELDGLLLRDGVFTLPLSPTNALTLTNLQTELRFGANDTWSFDRLDTDFAGTQIGISGEVRHAREALNWKLFGSGTEHRTNRGPAAASLKDFSEALQKIHFEGTPQLHLKFSGDARDVHSVTVQMDAAASGVRTPWFTATNFQIVTMLTAPADAPTNCDTVWGFWTNLQPFRLSWSLDLGGLRVEKDSLRAIHCAGLWSAPMLAVSNFSARLGDGDIDAGLTLAVPTRRLEFKAGSSIDPKVIGAWLDKDIQAQLANVVWSNPPTVRVDGSLRLPPWTNFAAEYKSTPAVHAEIACTNVIVHGLKLDRIAARFRYDDLMWEVSDLLVAQGRTELHLNGQESDATKNFHFVVGGAFDANIIRPLLTNSNAVNGFNLVTLHEPLKFSLDVAGNLRRLETLTATGHVALANFAVRGQTIEQLGADVTYSNWTVVFWHPKGARAGGTQTFVAEKLTLDLAGERLFFDQALARVEPMAVGRAIGPKTAEAMAPYQFPDVPTAHVNGCVPLKMVDDDLVLDDADLRFDLVGTTPFRWRKFETPAMNGTIHWWKNLIIVTNTTGDCYGGTAQGWGVFDVKTPGDGTDFSFFVTGTNVDLHRMGQELWSPTNRLEGALAGTIFVTRANSDNWHTWNGGGNAHLRDGLLWDVPMFAFMSPVLNAVVPGLGNSRATEAKSDFILTNGVITTESLVIEAQSMRMNYTGTVDLEQKVNARVTARLLRNMPVVGSLISAALWPVSKIFECRVTGTLGDPVVKPIYIPKILLVPLHPIRSIEELFSSPATSTNAPPPAK